MLRSAAGAAPGRVPWSAPASVIASLQVAAQRHHDAGEWALAEQALRRLLNQAPPQAGTLSNLGLVLSRLGRAAEALACQRQALDLQPGLASAWVNLALALRGTGDLSGAAAADQQALRLDPAAPQAHVNIGIGLLGEGRLTEAMAAFRHALSLRHDLPETWINLGIALLESGDAQSAVSALRQAQQLAPHDRRAASNLLMALQYDPAIGADGLRQAAAQQALVWQAAGATTGPGQPAEPGASAPFLSRTSAWSSATAPAGNPRLRIGYVGGDFRQHQVGWLMADVLEAHDRAGFEIHLFNTRANLDATDALTQRLRAAADAWHEVHALDDAELAARVAQLGITVLVDLAGHTEHNRLGVFARRAAPVQLAWLGYFASTGLPAIDAVVLGGAMADAGAQQFYTEPLERLPRLHFAYAPPPYAPLPAPPPSLASGRVSFGSFNNPAKLSDATVALWTGALAAVPGSRLVLKWKCFGDLAFAEHTRRRFAAQGLDPQRLDLRPASAHPQMLAEYADIDIALDSLPFSGALTSLEALCMGVPVLTLPGRRPVSRQTLALLQALDLPDWVASTPRQFAALARRWADDLPGRQVLRQTLRQRLQASVLGDGAGLARALEQVYRRRCPAGAEPASAQPADAQAVSLTAPALGPDRSSALPT